MKDGVTVSSDGVNAGSASAFRVSRAHVEIALGILAVLVGLAACINLLNRGVFYDEFFTLAMTKPTQSLGEFYGLLKIDAHPSLYFLMVWAERALGIDTIALMRSINFIGLGVLAWAIRFAVKKDALSPSQGLALAALCVTSNVFLDAIGELRPYYYVACFTTAAALAWRVIWVELEKGERLTRGVLIAWGAMVGLTASFNYFAMAMCGLMAAALLGFAMVQRDRRSVIVLGVVSLAVVTPSLITALIQAPHQPKHFWIDTTPKVASEMFLLSWRGIVINNLAAFASFAVALLATIGSRDARKLHRSALVLLAATAMFYGLLFVLNAFKPMIIFRYLTAAIGPTVVVIVLMAVGRHAPRWTAAAISVCAILSGLMCIATGKHQRDGWDKSAHEVARRVEACPSTKVYVRTFSPEHEELDRLSNLSALAGYEYFRKLLGLPITDLPIGGVVPAGGECPNIYWAEHAFTEKYLNLDTAAALDFHKVSALGPAKIEYIGDGLLIMVGRAPN